MNLAKLQNIDRRYLYAALLLIVVVGLIVPIPLPLTVSSQARAFYNAIQSSPPGSFVIVCTNWSASTQGENRPQTRVILTHLMRNHIRFALMAFEPQSTTLAQELAEELAREYHYVYGTDWINLGYRADVNGTLKGMVQDIVQTFKTDSRERKPLSSFPVMAGIHSLKDVSVIAEVSPSGTYQAWVGLVVGSVKAPYCFAPTSVMAPEVYPYLDSGQIRGMLFGIKGAAEYEQLLGIKGFTTRAITPVSLSLILLFVLIGLGNWGMYATRSAGRRS